jgi:hypothetical protein
MKQQSLWEPMDGADMRACWRALPEASRAEIVEHLVCLVVRAELAMLKEGEQAVSQGGDQSTVADSGSGA